MKRMLVAIPLCLIAFIGWRVATPYENLHGVRARWLGWCGADCIVLQLGDWFRAQSPSLALLDLSRDKAEARELTGPGMDHFGGFQGLAFDIDETRNRIAVLGVNSARRLELGLGSVVGDPERNQRSVSLKRFVEIGDLQGHTNIDPGRPVAGMFFLDSGQAIVLSYDGRTVVIDFDTGQVYSSELHGQRIAAARDAATFVVNYETSCNLWRVSRKDPHVGIKVIATADQLVCTSDLVLPKSELASGRSDSVESMSISDDGNMFAVGTFFGVLGYKDLQQDRVDSIDVGIRISSVQIVQTPARILFGTGDQRIGQWELSSGKLTWIDTCQDHISHPVSRLRLTADARRMYATDYESRVIMIYNLENGTYKRESVLSMDRGVAPVDQLPSAP